MSRASGMFVDSAARLSIPPVLSLFPNDSELDVEFQVSRLGIYDVELNVL